MVLWNGVEISDDIGVKLSACIRLCTGGGTICC